MRSTQGYVMNRTSNALRQQKNIYHAKKERPITIKLTGKALKSGELSKKLAYVLIQRIADGSRQAASAAKK